MKNAFFEGAILKAYFLRETVLKIYLKCFEKKIRKKIQNFKFLKKHWKKKVFFFQGEILIDN